MPDQQLQVLVRAHLEKYGEAAATKARERAKALTQMGDNDGAKMWQLIADMLARVG